MNFLEQGAIVYVDFEPSKEGRKQGPAVVISRDEYSLSSNLIIVCPIISTNKTRPYLVALEHDALQAGSKVNTNQVYTLDYSEQGERTIDVFGKTTPKELITIAQHFLMNFNFQL